MARRGPGGGGGGGGGGRRAPVMQGFFLALHASTPAALGLAVLLHLWAPAWLAPLAQRPAWPMWALIGAWLLMSAPASLAPRPPARWRGWGCGGWPAGHCARWRCGGWHWAAPLHCWRWPAVSAWRGARPWRRPCWRAWQRWGWHVWDWPPSSAPAGCMPAGARRRSTGRPRPWARPSATPWITPRSAPRSAAQGGAEGRCAARRCWRMGPFG